MNVAELGAEVSGGRAGEAYGLGAARPDLALKGRGYSWCHYEASDPVALNAGLLYLVQAARRCPLSQARNVAGSAALVLVDGATPLRPEPALFEAMLEGWGRQQRSRRLSVPLHLGVGHRLEAGREIDSEPCQAGGPQLRPG